jgi:hypothetical protein
MFSCLELRGDSLRLCRLRTASVEPYETSIDYVLVYTRFMRSHKLSSFDDRRVARYLTTSIMMYTGIVYVHPQIAQRGIAWKTCTRERWDPDRLFDSCHELWPHVWFWRPCMCRVIRFSLTRCILSQISAIPSDMGDGLIAVSKCINSTFIILHMYMRMMSTTW